LAESFEHFLGWSGKWRRLLIGKFLEMCNERFMKETEENAGTVGKSERPPEVSQ